MQYALLIYESPAPTTALSDDERDGRDRRVHGAIRGRAARARRRAAAARRDRHHGPRGERQTLTTDGPFADTKEVFGGFYLLEADDLDAALEVAARIPAARLGGSVEVRPIVER